MRNALKNSVVLVGVVKALRRSKLDSVRLKGYLRRDKVIRNYLESHTVKKLQIGSGYNLLPGWLNTDFCPRSPEQAYVDATKRFPFEDATFDCIYSEHVIEHLGYSGAMEMLKECRRVLKPGGKFRVSTPDLNKILSLATSNKSEIQRKYIKLASDKHIPHARNYLASFVINNFFWDFGHYFVFDPETMEFSLKEAGFVDIKPCEIGKSSDPNLTNIESHAKIIGADMNEFETMIFEATRP